jgi:hypothetical protein
MLKPAARALCVFSMVCHLLCDLHRQTIGGIAYISNQAVLLPMTSATVLWLCTCWQTAAALCADEVRQDCQAKCWLHMFGTAVSHAYVAGSERTARGVCSSVNHVLAAQLTKLLVVSACQLHVPSLLQYCCCLSVYASSEQRCSSPGKCWCRALRAELVNCTRASRAAQLLKWSQTAVICA